MNWTLNTQTADSLNIKSTQHIQLNTEYYNPDQAVHLQDKSIREEVKTK